MLPESRNLWATILAVALKLWQHTEAAHQCTGLRDPCPIEVAFLQMLPCHTTLPMLLPHNDTAVSTSVTSYVSQVNISVSFSAALAVDSSLSLLVTTWLVVCISQCAVASFSLTVPKAENTHLLTHSLSPLLVLVVVMGSIQLQTSRSHAHSLILSLTVTMLGRCARRLRSCWLLVRSWKQHGTTHCH